MDLGDYDVALYVKDIERTADFYEGMGFHRIGVGGAEVGVISLVRGECRIGLYQVHLTPPEPQLIFWQGDSFALAHEIDGKGPVWDRGPSRDAASGHSGGAIWDPDGRFLYFINIPGLERGATAASA